MNTMVATPAKLNAAQTKAALFHKAFTECGIGGRFSKFRLFTHKQWISLLDVSTSGEAKYCFQIHTRVDRDRLESVESHEAYAFGKACSEWVSYFSTAQKVIARVVDHEHIGDNRYWIDRNHGSVFISNRLNVIEVSQMLRAVPEIPSHAVFNFLDLLAYREPGGSEEVKVFTRYGEVAIYYNGQAYYTQIDAEEFMDRYGV